MKNKKLLMRLLCALLSVLMLVCAIPAITVSADDGADSEEQDKIDWTSISYESPEARIAAMTKYFDNGEYSLYCDEKLGVVAYKMNATGEILFTNPWYMTK